MPAVVRSQSAKKRGDAMTSEPRPAAPGSILSPVSRRDLIMGIGGAVAGAALRSSASDAVSAAAAHGVELLVGSCYGKSVLRYDGSTGDFIDAFVTSGSGGLDCPEGTLLFGQDGHLYLPSFSPSRLEGGVPHRDEILRYDGETGEFIDIFVPPAKALDGPHGMAFGPDGNLYVGTRFSHSVLRYDAQSGALIDEFVSPGSGGLEDPSCLIFHSDGHLYVSSYILGAVLRYDGETGEFIDRFAPDGPESYQQAHLHHMVFGPDGYLYATSYPNNAVLRYDSESGEVIDVFVSPGSGDLEFPATLAFGPDGHLYVSAGGHNNEVLRYDGQSGVFIDAFIPSNRGGLHGPSSMTFRTSSS
jgi:DNA-binding beta-propeller fold protein YncE